MSDQTLEILSNVLGWIYTVAWSVSFYPQMILNHKRKSVTGLSFEYQAYNITGFAFYTVYCIANFIVQHQEPDLTESVEINDLVFAIHAVFATSIVIYQCVSYKLRSHTLNPYHLGLVVVFWLLLAYNIVLCIGGILPFANRTNTYQYSVCEYLGYVKVVISFVKYCPQAYMNWSRKSTVGWSVGNVLLDLTGGLLSFGQQGLNAYRKGNTDEFTSNITKLLLSVESVAFDLLFILQHYVLYRKNNLEIERRGILSREEAERVEAEVQAKAAEHARSLLKVGGSTSESSGEEYLSISGERMDAGGQLGISLSPGLESDLYASDSPNGHTATHHAVNSRAYDPRTHLLPRNGSNV